MNDKQIKIIIFCSLLILAGILVAKYFYKPCFIEEYTLINQSIEFSKECTGFSCLFIQVESKNGTISTLWFKDDTKLLSDNYAIYNGDKVRIQWCKIKNVGYRVRGLTKSLT